MEKQTLISWTEGEQIIVPLYCQSNEFEVLSKNSREIQKSTSIETLMFNYKYTKKHILKHFKVFTTPKDVTNWKKKRMLSIVYIYTIH